MRKTAEATLTLEQRNTFLRKWLKEHDLFNLAALCRRINYDRGAFSHWLEGHQNWDLSEDVIKRVETAVSDYGYILPKTK